MKTPVMAFALRYIAHKVNFNHWLVTGLEKKRHERSERRERRGVGGDEGTRDYCEMKY